LIDNQKPTRLFCNVYFYATSDKTAKALAMRSGRRRIDRACTFMNFTAPCTISSCGPEQDTINFWYDPDPRY